MLSVVAVVAVVAVVVQVDGDPIPSLLFVVAKLENGVFPRVTDEELLGDCSSLEQLAQLVGVLQQTREDLEEVHLGVIAHDAMGTRVERECGYARALEPSPQQLGTDLRLLAADQGEHSLDRGLRDLERVLGGG
ncbi:hypothetical protein ON010_g3232 [Phytophthora cinnamomi]|nr:hypothetical protein ON010_g3232 [Phytophthora cinnamomi]